MKQKKKKSHAKQILLLAIILGFDIGLWRAMFGGTTVRQEKAQEILAEDHDYHYFYTQLNKDEQQLYEKMFYTVSQFKKEIKLDTQDVESVKKVYEYMFYDHPELYYLNSQFEYRLQNHALIFMPLYDENEKEVNDHLQKIEDSTKDIIAQAKQQETSLEKARVIYDYVIEKVTYGENEGIDQNMLSALIDGKSVCAGYARAYQYLLNQVGVESVLMVGNTKASSSEKTNQGHAWVMLHLDDDYYYSDPTWGDVVDDHMTHTCYGYFLMTSDEMLSCYDVECAYEKTKKTANPYYVSVGCYMSSYNEKVIQKAIQKGLKDQTYVAEIKCGSKTVYQQLKKNIQQTYLGYKLLKAEGCWSNKCTYQYIDELGIIELYY